MIDAKTMNHTMLFLPVCPGKIDSGHNGSSALNFVAFGGGIRADLVTCNARPAQFFQ